MAKDRWLYSKLLNVTSLVIAIVFIFAGLVKANDPLGMQYKLEDYAAVMGVSTDEFWMCAFAVLLAMVEFSTGVMLMMKQRVAVVAALLMMVVMTPLSLWLALTDAVPDCGCFGDAILLTNWQTLTKNIVLLVLCVLMMRHSRAWRWWKHTWIMVLPMLGVLILSLYSRYALPPVDFRPYHVGADINKMDTFFVEDVERGDVTEELLHRAGYTYLLIAPRLETADESDFSDYNSLYRECCNKEMPFYCVTASDENAREEWRKRTMAKYPFLSSDDTELKTIVRSNPGLVVIKDGRVVAKYSHNDIPKEVIFNK